MKNAATLFLVSALILPASDAYAINCKLNTGVTKAQAQRTMCNFDWDTLQFAGTPSEQARCLTRHVGPSQNIGEPELPDRLASLVGKPVDVTAEAAARYVQSLGVKEADIGGSLHGTAPAEYFVIHDTSVPNCSERDWKRYCPVLDAFPEDRDRETWLANQNFFGHPKPAPDRIGHVIVNRVGKSVTEVDFANPLQAIKFQSCEKAGAVDRFLSIENIQPRIRNAEAADGDAPVPGFGDLQYDRLGLLYVIASVRHKSWMIPAYHAVIDAYYREGHDDPRNFEIAKFDAAVTKHKAAIESFQSQ